MVRDVRGVPVTPSEAGEPGARPALLLHGGAGPASMSPLVEHLAVSHRVLVPTHPGWQGTPRPASLDTVRSLAGVYLDLLEQLDLRDVVLVGSSFGGWVASRLATDDAARIGALVLLDALGPEVPGHPPRPPRPRGTTPSGGAPASGPAPADLAALMAYTGGSLVDADLLTDLARLSVPALLLWGADDQIVTTDFGRAYADAVPGARFVVVPGAGHLPVWDAPQAVLAVLDEFLSAGSPPAR